jgi:aminomethyltransferase
MLMSELLKTPLHDLHVGLGAKMVPFAGYDMPVQYPLGVMKEHNQTRTKAGLFDVSHMGQVRIDGAPYADLAAALETMLPVNAIDLAEARQRYGFFTNDVGGIEDDLMFANRGDHIFMVVNAACKDADIARLKSVLEPALTVTPITDRALIALQGPSAEAALATLNPAVADMKFMDVATIGLAGADCWISRSGYTGEDGYEISVPNAQAVALTQKLLDHPDVEAIGLGARDSLRLEGGLCLYGHDIDTATSPVEAGLTWAIQKIRRNGGERAGGFPGADRILREFDEGASQKRVGLLPEGRAPMREGVELFETADSQTAMGRITSGGFGPTVGHPVAMGYLAIAHTEIGTTVYGDLRGKRLPMKVVKMPFTPANFKR